jgi:hypothetical protein
MKVKDRRGGRPAAVILEEATHLLRSQPAVLLPYYIGTLPFVLGMLFFWTDMASGATAWRHVTQSAWVMVLLFVWMKGWQCGYGRALSSQLTGDAPSRWGIRDMMRMLAIQTVIQAWGVVALPLSFVVMLPFPQTVAFFQNVTVLGFREEGATALARRAWRHAAIWPFQNSLIIWLTGPILIFFVMVSLYGLLCLVTRMVSFGAPDLPDVSLSILAGLTMLLAIPLCPLGLTVMVNIGMGLLAVPWILSTLFGIDTALSRDVSQIATSSVFFALVSGLTYLFLDPVFKASYALRCFYSDSIPTGQDLRTELRAFQKAKGVAAILLLVVTIAFSVVVPGWALSSAEKISEKVGTGPSVETLDAAIERTVNRPEYAWRMPREKPPQSEKKGGIIRDFVKSIAKTVGKGLLYLGKVLRKTVAAIRDFFSRSMPHSKATPTDSSMATRLTVAIPVAGLVLLALFLWWRARKVGRAKTMPAVSVAGTIPDIRSDDVDAAALSEDGWISMARDLIEKGELRLAVRAFYLATLAFLASRDLITIEKYKSDREYEMELSRRSHAYPGLIIDFGESRSVFERSWYGNHPVSLTTMEEFSRIHARVRENAKG